MPTYVLKGRRGADIGIIETPEGTNSVTASYEWTQACIRNPHDMRTPDYIAAASDLPSGYTVTFVSGSNVVFDERIRKSHAQSAVGGEG